MNIKVSGADILQYGGDALIVNLFEKVKKPGGATGAVDAALDGVITALIKDGQIKGGFEETHVIPTFGKIGAKKVIVVGLGEKDKFDADRVRRAAAASCRAAERAGAKTCATILHGAGAGGMEPQTAAQCVAEGALLGLYKFDKYITKKKDDEKKRLRELVIIERDAAKLTSIRAGVSFARVMASAGIMARDLINEPPNVINPAEMVRRAKAALKDTAVTVKVFGKKDLEKMKMGAYLGVSAGSAAEPQFIVMSYRGDPRSKKTLALVGKGVTFDSGGLSLKPSKSMSTMKGDMSGAANVIAAMVAIAQLRPKVNVTGLAPCVENMPDGAAQRVDDIRTAMNGKTIEIDNTDAEGRLILADAICYAKQQGFAPIIDIATLTGACVVALGDVRSGAFTNDEKLLDKFKEASAKTGEKIWHLPTDDEYKEMNKSKVADIKNTGGSGAGAITAAQFLHFFIEDTPWVHFDIAGTFLLDKTRGYMPTGATGQITRTLIQFLLDYKA